MPKHQGNLSVDTPMKAKISRYYQSLGGEKTRGAASATARKFGLNPSSGPNLVKKYDKEVADGEARRKYKGKATSFNEGVARKIDAQFEDDETATYAGAAAAQVGIPQKGRGVL